MSKEIQNQDVETPEENQTESSASGKPPESNVVALDTAREAGSVAAQERSVSIIQLCGLAGMPEKAEGFIKGSLPMAEIQKSLVTSKANADQLELENQSDESMITSQPNQGSRGFHNKPTADLEKSPLVLACTKLAAQSASGV